MMREPQGMGKSALLKAAWLQPYSSSNAAFICTVQLTDATSSR